MQNAVPTNTSRSEYVGSANKGRRNCLFHNLFACCGRTQAGRWHLHEIWWPRPTITAALVREYGCSRGCEFPRRGEVRDLRHGFTAKRRISAVIHGPRSVRRRRVSRQQDRDAVLVARPVALFDGVSIGPGAVLTVSRRRLRVCQGLSRQR
jgi:hypothetical protein